MKKNLLFVFALVLSFGLKAQCPYTTAFDFTATDCHGTEVHLFDILDGGQYVLIDFFFTTCGPCQQATPKIVESYYAFGCNMHDVYYIEISTSDGDAACQNWAANYGVEYPTISTAGGGNTICSQYGISQYPTIILIAPDRSIVIQDLWPISNAQTVINALTPYGIEEHDCTEPVGELTITPDTLWFYNMGEDQTFTILNETDEAVTIDDIIPEGGSALEVWQPSLPVTLETGESIDVVIGYQVPPLKDEFTSFVISVLTSVGEKEVIAMIDNHANENGLNLGPSLMMALDTENPSTDLYLSNGNAGTLTPFEISSISEVPDEGGPYLNIELSSELPYTLDYGSAPFYFTISPLHAGTKDGAHTSIEVNYTGGTSYYEVWIDEALLSIAEINNEWRLFPNPANESLTLKGKNLGTVRIFNTLGQKVDEIEANGNELNINTTGYESGIYVVKMGAKAVRFVVKL